MSMKVPIKALDGSLAVPSYAHKGDAGFDLRAAEDAVVEPLGRKQVRCGFAIAIPEGHAGLVIPRSGLAARHGIGIVNAPGLVDSGYRGEVMAVLHNTDKDNAFKVRKGDRIAQMAIVRMPSVELVEADDLGPSERGCRGFGSSGVE